MIAAPLTIRKAYTVPTRADDLNTQTMVGIDIYGNVDRGTSK